MRIVSSLRTASRQYLLRPRLAPHESQLHRRFFSSEACHVLAKSHRANDRSRFGLAAASAAAATTSILLAQNEDESSALAIISTESELHSPTEALHFFEPGTVEEIQYAVSRMRQALQEANQRKDITERRKKKKVNQDFPSLAVSTFNNNCGEGEFELNAPEPIPIENDFFKGKLVINVRPNQNQESSPSKEDLFDIQIQGQFKRVPRGTLYVGAELADADFQFNRLMRGLSNVLLGLLAQCIGDDIRYSFGERALDGRRQLAHISFPLKTAMDSFLATPPGETPPALRSAEFVETSESRSMRKNSADINDWNTDGTTYSLAFRGSCIDLITWRVIDPFDVSLVRFWGKSPLRLVIYEKGEGPQSSTTSIHDQVVQDTNNYLLALQVNFLGANTGVDTTVVDRKKGAVQASPLALG